MFILVEKCVVTYRFILLLLGTYAIIDYIKKKKTNKTTLET